MAWNMGRRNHTIGDYLTTAMKEREKAGPGIEGEIGRKRKIKGPPKYIVKSS